MMLLFALWCEMPIPGDGFLQKNYPDNINEMFEKLSKILPF